MCVSHPKTLTSQKLSSPLGLLGLKIFHGFGIIGGRIEPIVCLVFYVVIKMLENIYKNSYQNLQTAVKIFNKHQNVQTGTHTKKQTLFHRFLGEYTLFLTHLLFERGRVE